MTYFSSLRTIPFEPTFDWVYGIEEVAKKINLPHEDFPSRIVATKAQITGMADYFEAVDGKLVYDIPPITIVNIQKAHAIVFPDDKWSGNWREVNVQLNNGTVHPPQYQKIDTLMNQLELLYEDKELTIDVLMDWYIDFEIIHPFCDGNGRVGGIIVAAYSHLIHPEMGWLGPNQ